MKGEKKGVLSMSDKEIKKAYGHIMRGADRGTLNKGCYQRASKSGYRKVSLLRETSVRYSVSSGC